MTGQPMTLPGVPTTTVETTPGLPPPTARDWLFGTAASLAPTILRWTLAIVMFPHGAQKVFGWFGGHGAVATVKSFHDQMGLPAFVAWFAMATELGGSILLALGLLTRPVALAFVALMIGAIATVHAKFGFFMNWFGAQQGEGFEYHLLVIGIALALLVAGGGLASVDRAIVARLKSAHDRSL